MSIKDKKRVCPSTDPWRTPNFKAAGTEAMPLTEMTWIGPEVGTETKKGQCQKQPKKMMESGDRMQWLILSKMENRSRRGSREIWLTSTTVSVDNFYGQFQCYNLGDRQIKGSKRLLFWRYWNSWWMAFSSVTLERERSWGQACSWGQRGFF